MMTQSLFWTALAVLIYTYAGYPLLLAAWARVRPMAVQRAPYTPSVAIVVVAYNEAAQIRAKIDTCLAQNYPPDRLRLLIVSDGSQDGTRGIVEAYPDPRVQLLAFAQRRGKASCLNDAIAACSEDYLVLTDARQALDPDAVRCLLENFADPTVGAASGELKFMSDGKSQFGEGVDAYWRYEKFVRECESAVGSVVGVTGALYALRRSLFASIPSQTILDDVLIPLNVVLQRSRVLLDRRAIAWDRVARTPAQERVRKVRTLAGNFQLLATRPCLLLPWRNPLFLQFVSHKALRLLGPPLLLLLLATAAALARSDAFWAAMLALQLIGYSLASAGAVWPNLARLPPVRLARTFLVMNGFIVLGLLEFMSNRKAHLWSVRAHAAADSNRATSST
jgi:biofilm PGA synthesis N-glycosyltransferase PgaC